jgi:hypothetical protein
MIEKNGIEQTDLENSTYVKIKYMQENTVNNIYAKIICEIKICQIKEE